jgi:hypothetical protein
MTDVKVNAADIRQIRTKRRLTQSGLAETLGVSLAAIQKAEYSTETLTGIVGQKFLSWARRQKNKEGFPKKFITPTAKPAAKTTAQPLSSKEAELRATV